MTRDTFESLCNIAEAARQFVECDDDPDMRDGGSVVAQDHFEAVAKTNYAKELLRKAVVESHMLHQPTGNDAA